MYDELMHHGRGHHRGQLEEAPTRFSYRKVGSRGDDASQSNKGDLEGL